MLATAAYFSAGSGYPLYFVSAAIPKPGLGLFARLTLAIVNARLTLAIVNARLTLAIVNARLTLAIVNARLTLALRKLDEGN